MGGCAEGICQAARRSFRHRAVCVFYYSWNARFRLIFLTFGLLVEVLGMGVLEASVELLGVGAYRSNPWGRQCLVINVYRCGIRVSAIAGGIAVYGPSCQVQPQHSIVAGEILNLLARI